VLSPPSFRLAFKPHRATAAELKKIAGTRIQTDVCAPNGWLFDDRVKSEESALAKLQFGPVRSLGEMNDLYAATVVVPTPKEIPLAVKAIKDSLPDAIRSRRRIGKANTFEYDDVHVIAALGKEAAALSPGLRDRKFEVQIHTGLQYAWWRATHDVIYKGSQRSWQLIRMASQIRASLELLDATLSNLRGAANLLPAATDKDDAQFRESMRWLEKWPDEEKPEDRLRFASSTIELANASDLSLAKIEALLDQGLISDSGTTPFQAVLGSVVAAHGAGVLEGLKARRYVLVTEAFEAACPTICEVPPSRRATLDAQR
jgi:ppGpp synthetase/RelA/SpoT-type nucleotidyltranferase